MCKYNLLILSSFISICKDNNSLVVYYVSFTFLHFFQSVKRVFATNNAFFDIVLGKISLKMIRYFSVKENEIIFGKNV